MNREIRVLEPIARNLDSDYCDYFDCGNYEALEIHTQNEKLVVDYFGGEVLTQVRFSGDVKRIKRTVDYLKIPTSWPSNLGEKVFYRFRQSLEDLDEGEVTIQQDLKPGKEHQLKNVLNRLVDYYKSQR